MVNIQEINVRNALKAIHYQEQSAETILQDALMSELPMAYAVSANQTTLCLDTGASRQSIKMTVAIY